MISQAARVPFRTVYSYRVYGVTIGSEEALPVLGSPVEAAPDWHLQPCTGPIEFDEKRAYHRWVDEENRPVLAMARDGDAYQVHVPECARFRIDLSRRTIAYTPAAHVAPGAVHHALLDQVLPLALSEQNRLALHASAVAVNGSAIAFIGSSGQGKSTLMWAFAKEGCPVMTDDCLLANESPEGHWSAQPGYPSLRLWPSTFDLLGEHAVNAHLVKQNCEKTRLPLQGILPYQRDAVPLTVLFLLEPGGDEISASRLTQRESLFALRKAAFRLDPFCAIRSRAEFARLTRAALTLPVFRLRYPLGGRYLREIYQTVRSTRAE